MIERLEVCSRCGVVLMPQWEGTCVYCDDTFARVFGYVSGECLTEVVTHSAGSSNYRAALRSAVRALWSGAADFDQFWEIMETTTRFGMTQAFTEGSKECGILPSEWTVAERTTLQRAILYEQQWITGFAEAIEKGSKANGGKLGALWPRAEIWIGRYEGLRDKAKVMTCADKKLMWVLGSTKNPCSSCTKLNRKVKRASFWLEKGILPRVHGAWYLECAGFRCDCQFLQTDEPLSRGPLPSLP